MTENSKPAPFELNGRWQYRLRSLLMLYRSLVVVPIRRLFRGPLLPNWSLMLEVSTHFIKTQTSIGFDMPDPADGREYEDSFVFGSPAVGEVNIQPVNQPVKGHWYSPKSGANNITMLYLHGGGYTYYSKAHNNLIALVTLAAGSRTFAPDYRLTPEHPYPAQMEDALASYRWLLETGVDPRRLVVAGDSAGGHLTLTLLLALRDAGLPLPAGAICLAPWTDLTNPGASMSANAAYDWIEKRMAERWTEYFCKESNPPAWQVSPIQADLRGLPPIYIQAGTAEILYDMIRAFAARAQEQGANVKLETWDNMTHDFQSFGSIIPESQDALRRIGEVAREFVG